MPHNHNAGSAIDVTAVPFVGGWTEISQPPGPVAALAGALDRQRHGRAICCLCGASLPDISVTKGAYVFHEPETDRFSAALVCLDCPCDAATAAAKPFYPRSRPV